MAGYLNVLFPEAISYGASGGPEFSTNVVRGRSGREARNINWQHPLRRWEVGRYAYDQGLITELLAFWHVVAGRAYSFRFRDWTDHAAGGQDGPDGFEVGTPVSIGTGNGTATTFQLVKSYAFGGQTYSRTIRKPMSGAKIYLAGVLQESGYTINSETGVVTFTTAPSNGVAVAWAGMFWIEARFDSDAPGFTFESLSSVEMPSIMVQEVRA